MISPPISPSHHSAYTRINTEAKKHVDPSDREDRLLVLKHNKCASNLTISNSTRNMVEGKDHCQYECDYSTKAEGENSSQVNKEPITPDHPEEASLPVRTLTMERPSEGEGHGGNEEKEERGGNYKDDEISTPATSPTEYTGEDYLPKGKIKNMTISKPGTTKPK